METEELITAEEVGKKLGRSKDTVQRWRREGVIPAAVAEKGCLRFSWPAVREALAIRAAGAARNPLDARPCKDF